MRRLPSLLVIFALLVACHPQPSSTPLPPTSPYPSSTVITARTPLPTSQSTALLVPGALAASPIPNPLSTAAPDPLRFIFPTPRPAPVSAWRPPLYPTPWAPSPYDHFYFASPIAANEVNWPVADYRYGGEFFEDVVHTGVDIPAPKGTPVLAAGPGRVVWAGYGIYRGGYDESDPYGLAVSIRHDFGYQGEALYTIYGHLDRVDVAEGQHVETGDQLGLVGETGRVTGPHLHFEVRLGTNSFYSTRNPELWLVPPQGWGVLAGRVIDSGSQPVSGQLIVVHSLQNDQNWFANSYGVGAVNSDPYYQENLVVSDLPAGRYELRTAYAGVSYSMEMDILPGVVNYFIFRGFDDFYAVQPPAPGANFTPQPLETPTP